MSRISILQSLQRQSIGIWGLPIPGFVSADLKTGKLRHPQIRINPMEVKSREKGNGSHFVLVHGACHGAWCWYKLSDLLEKAGHVVTAIDLGGGGINPKDGDAIRSLAEYNEPLAKFMKDLPKGDGAEKDEKVILVGHSMGGVNLTCTMEQFPHRIAVAVFVTAFMPVPGATPLQLMDESLECT